MHTPLYRYIIFVIQGLSHDTGFIVRVADTLHVLPSFLWRGECQMYSRVLLHSLATHSVAVIPLMKRTLDKVMCATFWHSASPLFKE